MGVRDTDAVDVFLNVDPDIIEESYRADSVDLFPEFL